MEKAKKPNLDFLWLIFFLQHIFNILLQEYALA